MSFLAKLVSIRGHGITRNKYISRISPPDGPLPRYCSSLPALLPFLPKTSQDGESFETLVTSADLLHICAFPVRFRVGIGVPLTDQTP